MKIPKVGSFGLKLNDWTRELKLESEYSKLHTRSMISYFGGLRSNTRFSMVPTAMRDADTPSTTCLFLIVLNVVMVDGIE